MKAIDVFILAHRMEFQGMKFYAEQKEAVEDPALKSIFADLEKMEEGHALYLEGQLNRLKGGETIQSPPKDEENVFQARRAQQEIQTEKLTGDMGDYTIVRMAYLIEKDFVQFYAKAANENEGELADVFTTLSEWEQEHADMMQARLEAILERNALDLGFYPF